MNATAQMLLRTHDGPAVTVYPGAGFDNLTTDTACTYMLDSDHRILSTVLETTADEPLDDVCDFFNQQVFLATKPSARMQEYGIRRCYGDVLVVRLAFDGVPEWFKSVIEGRMAESMNVISTHRRHYNEDELDEGA